MSTFVQHHWSGGIYPERDEPRFGKADRFGAAIGGLLAPILRPRPRRFQRLADAVNAVAGDWADMEDARLPESARDLGLRLRREGFQRDVVARTFALVREASWRTLGLRHFDAQLIGGAVLLGGMVAEMETGEGKTLTATLPACTLALSGVPVHIITANDYLAQRDADLMGPVYRMLGLTVGTIVHGLDPETRRKAYRCDITYCTNKEVAFDYLRDRIILWDRPSALRLQLEKLYGDDSRVDRLVMAGLPFAIVDEADSVLIDEARTPLIISSETEDMYPPELYQFALESARSLNKRRDFSITGDRTLELTHRGRARIGMLDWEPLGVILNEGQREELVRQALVALHLYERDRHYLVKEEKIQIIDEYTGRLMADRSWERGLHQLIEVKEGCAITPRKETQARISYQRFFRRYFGLAGMTGTAREVSRELWSVYRLKVVPIPTHRPMQRRYLSDRVYGTHEKKWEGVLDAITREHKKGRPVLVGTRSVDASEHLSGMLTTAHLAHRVLNARQDQEEAEIIAEAGEKARITVATNMAGRGTDIQLGEAVAGMGGLHVIATERHEAGRIDRQLFGRCGRQGDPGSCEAIVSFEDELVQMHLWSFLRRPAVALLTSSPGRLRRRIVGILFRRAQRRAERQHYRALFQLLKYDDQLNRTMAFSGRPE